MKLLLLIITFSMTFVFSVEAAEYDEKIIMQSYDEKIIKRLEQWNVYFGDPRENKIIGQGDMYVVIHNPTELALTVMGQRAKDYCKQTLGNNYTSIFFKILGRYAAYFSCEMQNLTDQYDLSEKEERCILGGSYYRVLNSQSCSDFNEKNVEVIRAAKLQKENEDEYKTFDFVYSVRTKFYNKIEEFEQAAEDKKINKLAKKHTKICKNHFEEGSQLYGECILTLIEKVEKAPRLGPLSIIP